MSVVKKYLKGGAAPDPNKYSDYTDFIRKKLEATKFTAKAEPLARGVAKDWESLVTSPDFDTSYSYDPITEQYGVDSSKITSEQLKTKDWIGSKDAINTNVWGQYTSRLDRSNKGDEGDEIERRKFNSLMANWTNEYLSEKKGKATPEPTGNLGTQSIGDYTTYVNKSLYGGGQDFEQLWAADMSKIESIDDRKKKIMSHAPEILATFKDPNKRQVGWAYTEVENEAALLDAVTRGDWESFTTEAKKIGWRPDSLLMEKTKEQLELEKTAKEGEETNSFIEDMRKKGYSDEIIQQVIAGGYTKPGTFSGPQWVTEDIEKNGLVLTNPTNGKTIVIGKSGLYNPRYTDPDAYEDAAYGTYLEHKDGQVGYYDKTTEGYDKSLFADPYEQRNYRPIEGTVAEYPDWHIYGVPKRSGGGDNYAKRLIIQDPITKETKEVIKEGNVYKTVDGKPLTIDIKAYSERPSELSAHHISFLGLGDADIFKQIEAAPLSEGENTTQLLSKAQTVLNDSITRNFENTGADLLKKLKWVAENDKFILNRDKASQLYGDFLKRLREDPDLNATSLIESLMYHYKESSKPPIDVRTYKEGVKSPINWLTSKFFKEGGVLSMESGGKANSIDEYISKYGGVNTPPASKRKSDIRDTLADATAAQKVSMLGAAASIIPGVGAIGAGVSTLADIVDDLEDDGKINNWGTHAMNAGFIALSAIGLGGLKTAQAGYKATQLARLAGLPAQKAKALPKLVALAEKKGITALSKMQNVDKIDSGIVKLSQIKSGSFKNAGITKDEFIALKKANLLNPKANLGQTVKKGLSAEASKKYKIAKVLDQEAARATKVGQNAPAPITQKAPNFLQREFSGTLGLLNGVKSPNWAKAANIAGTGLRGAGLIAGGLSAARVATGAVTEGTEGVNVNDMKGALYLAGGLRGFMKSRQLANMIKNPNLLTKGKTVPGTITVKGAKPIALKEDLTVPKTKMFFGKKQNEESLGQFKEQLKKSIGDDAIFKQHFENLKDLKGVKITAAKETTGKLLSQAKSGLSPKEYARLKDALSGKINNYFLPNWYRGSYLKDGGVIKLLGGGSAATGWQGLNFKGLGNLIGKANIDNTDFLNVLNYAQTKRSNERNTALQRQAVASAVTKSNAVSPEYIRTANTSKPYYDAQATGIMNIAKRMSKNTSDPSLAASIMYSGADKAREASTAGIAAGQQEIQQGVDRQQQSNRQTYLTNLDVDYRNRAAGNDAISKMYQLESNKELADTTATQNLLLAFGQNKQLKDQKLKYQNYYDAVTDPQRKLKIDEYGALEKEIATQKSLWEKAKAASPNAVTGTWEESDVFKNLSKQIEGFSKYFSDYSDRTRNLGLALQMPGRIGYNAKGGTLADKKELARYTSEIKRNNADIERTFKMILKNNELMQKSLIKIFK